MSHSVIITRTTTTTSSSNDIILNTGYLKTTPGFLKLAQLILGIVCVGLVGYYSKYGTYVDRNSAFFFFIIAVTFMIGTFLILFSCLISLGTATLLSQSSYETVYHFVACILYFAASITLMVAALNQKYDYAYEAFLAASIIGLIIAGLYLFSGILAAKRYRGI